jgi:GNAT superfamily N-acetyltransferase
MQQLSVTRLEPADQDTVVGLLVAQTREHRIQVESESLSQVVARVLSDERYGFLLVARVDRDIVGVAYVATILSVEHGGPVGWVEELYVSPAYRGQGVGRALLNGVLEQAQELGLVALDLELDVEHERAESLYARFGFRKLMRSRWVRALTPK